MERYILSIDQSTAGTKAILFDNKGSLIARKDKAHKQITNDFGWVEHNPDEIWKNLLQVVSEVITKAGISSEQILAIALANQRETAVVWDKKTGNPVYNAIVWQCPRGEAICKKIASMQKDEEIRQITGFSLSPYFTAAKIAWVLQNQPVNLNELCAGTMDSWLIYKMTNGNSFLTDYSNASRTQLMDLKKLQWSEQMAKLFGIPVEILPKIMPSDSDFGTTNLDGILSKPVPICSAIGDSHAALFGQGCHKPGMIKATYGTGSSVMMNIGDSPIIPKHGLVGSVAWGVGGNVNYVLEGNINYTGAVMKWISDDLGLINSPKDAEKTAKTANPKDTTYLVPAFSGLSAPYWDSDARATFCGMSRTTKKAELVKAAEESIALQISDVVCLMQAQSSTNLAALRVDGGPTRDKFLMQFQADILNIAVQVADVEELSALGAAFIAGIKHGFYKTEMLEQLCRTTFMPAISQAQRLEKKEGWNKAVKTVLT